MWSDLLSYIYIYICMYFKSFEFCYEDDLHHFLVFLKVQVVHEVP